MSTAIAFQGVRFTYDGEEHALDGIDLSIEDGEYVSIVGGNASGKSTLVRHINGLLIPDEGKVLVKGMNTQDPRCLMRIRACVGMVFQNPDDQLVASVVENEVAFGPENMGLLSEEIERRVVRALEVVGLDGFEKRRVDELSGGQKQRVAIAGALALDPEILVLDEATAMLDPMGKAGLMRVIDRLNASGMTIVMITHDVHEARRAGRCIMLDKGRVAGSRRRGDDAANAPVDAAAFPYVLSARGEVIAKKQISCDAPGRCVCGAKAALTVDDDAACPVIAVKDVSYSYEKVSRRRSAFRRREHVQATTPRWGSDPCASWALCGLTFDVRAGEVFGIAGHTGSGKSTLLKLMGGFEQVTSGRILLAGNDLSDKKVACNACAHIGLAFQYPEYQLFASSVKEDIAFGPRNLGLPPEEVEQRVSEALDLVGLPASLLEKSPFELSGGQQRCVALAGIVAMKPDVLMLDEPAAGLDSHGKAMLQTLIGRLRDAGHTVVLVSHCMDDLAALCNRVLVLNQGECYALGTPREVFADRAALQAIGLDAPRGLAAGGISFAPPRSDSSGLQETEDEGVLR